MFRYQLTPSGLKKVAKVNQSDGSVCCVADHFRVDLTLVIGVSRQECSCLWYPGLQSFMFCNLQVAVGSAYAASFLYCAEKDQVGSDRVWIWDTREQNTRANVMATAHRSSYAKRLNTSLLHSP